MFSRSSLARLHFIAWVLVIACSSESSDPQVDSGAAQDAGSTDSSHHSDSSGQDANEHDASDAAPDAPPADGEPGDAGPKPTLRVLFIGNSYTAVNSLPTVLAKLSEASQSPVSFVVAQHTPGGATFDDHNVNPAVDQLIAQGWHHVVLQDQSQQPWIYKANAKPELLSLDSKITAAGAKTLLFMTWARSTDVVTHKSRFAMDMAVNHYYERHAEAVGAGVAPVGRAWERARRDPTLTLHSSDGSHPNENGTYLAACVFYATLTNTSPLGLGSGGLNVPAALQTRLQQTAWDTHLARQRAQSPAIGSWPLSATTGGQDIAPFLLTLGGLTGPTGTPQTATQFETGKYAGIPYFPGINAPKITVAFDAYRADWSVPTALPEMFVSKSFGYQLQQSGVTLEAKLYTTSGDLSPDLTHSVAGLSPGWHHFALTYDGASYALWVDASKVASAPITGDIRYYPLAPDYIRYNAISVGAHNVDPTSLGVAATASFTGALSNLRLFDRALSQAELQNL